MNSPASGEAEGELGEFLDGILFSPEGTSPVPPAEGLFPLEPNPPEAKLSSISRAMAGGYRSSQLIPSPIRSAATGKSPEAPMAMMKSAEAMPSSDVVMGPPHCSEKPSSEGNESSQIVPSPIRRGASKSSEVQKPIVESSEAMSLDGPDAQLDSEKPSAKGDEAAAPLALLVSQSEMKPKDILCLRGSGGIGNPANIFYRQLMMSSRAYFSTLSTEEKKDFTAEFWATLRDKGHRFLLPTAEGSQYQVLDDALSEKKCLLALRECRGRLDPTANKERAPDVAAMSDSFDYTQPAKLPPPQKKQKRKWKSGKPAPVEPKRFDDTAMLEISKILDREDLAAAMRKTWGGDFENRRRLFEGQLLTRYRAAALHGMSVEEYSSRLLPALLKEAEASREVETASEHVQQVRSTNEDESQALMKTRRKHQPVSQGR